MHPSLAHRYGLRSPEDVAIAECFMAAAKKAGWTKSQLDGFLTFYATVAPALETGRVTPEQTFEQLFDFAELQGVGTDQRVAMADWYGATGRYIEAHGELPPLEQAAPAAIAAELAEIEKVQREDPHRYWRDEALQHRMHDLIEQGRGEVVPLATDAGTHGAARRARENDGRSQLGLVARPGSGCKPGGLSQSFDFGRAGRCAVG